MSLAILRERKEASIDMKRVIKLEHGMGPKFERKEVGIGEFKSGSDKI